MFSVLIPTFNRAELITEALDSVKRQSYRPIEIIVVDDGSTDSTRQIVHDWELRNSESSQLQLSYFYQENAGAPAARNRCIANSKGDYIHFLDSDDLLHPGRFEILSAIFDKHRDVELIMTGFDGFCDRCGTVFEQHYGRESFDPVSLVLRGHLWVHPLRFTFTRSLVRRIGPWRESMRCFQDKEYVERAMFAASGVHGIRDILGSARRGGKNRISDRHRTHEGRGFRILCEEALAAAIRGRSDIRQEDIQEFASRLYALGFRSAASGWPDHARRCGELAESLGVPLDAKGRRRRLAWRLGKWGGRLYEGLANLRPGGRNSNGAGMLKCNCREYSQTHIKKSN